MKDLSCTDGKVTRKPSKLFLSRETVRALNDEITPDQELDLQARTYTCIITGHPCPIPCF